MCYLKGEHVEKNQQKAVELLEAAAAQNHAGSIRLLRYLEEEEDGQQEE